LDKDLHNLDQKPTPSESWAFSNRKNLLENNEMLLNFVLVWNTYAHHLVTMVWNLIDKKAPCETFVVLHNFYHCIHTMQYQNNKTSQQHGLEAEHVNHNPLQQRTWQRYTPLPTLLESCHFSLLLSIFF